MKAIYLFMALCAISCSKDCQNQNKQPKTPEVCSSDQIQKSIDFDVITGQPKKIQVFFYSGERIDSIFVTGPVDQYVIKYVYIDNQFRQKTFHLVSGTLPVEPGSYFYEQLDLCGNVVLWTHETELGELIQKGSSQFNCLK